MRAAVAGIVLAAGAACGLLATPHRLGDSSSYVMMADSLWYDHDLRYEPADLARARALRFEDLPAGLLLVKRADGAYAYGKPVSYPLAALPWYVLFGLRGFLAFNGALLAALVLLGMQLLAPALGWGRAALATAGVYAFSATPAYLHWIDPFLFLTVLVAVGTVAYRRGFVVASGCAFAVAAASRFPYGVVALVPLLLHLRAHRTGAALRYGAAAVITLVALHVLTYASAGEWSPYVGDRLYFLRGDPFADAGEPGVPFSRARLLADWRPPALADVTRGLAHFVVGRFGGILLYFPTFFACLLWARRWNAEKLCWLGAVFGFALALELTVPHNRIGGAHALGNRFFVLLPLALCTIDFLAWRPWRVAGSLALAALALPILHAPVESSLRPGRMLLAWPHRLFPFEWELAEHVSYPAAYPGLYALTANQHAWEPASGTLWTVGAARAEFVLVRTGGQPARVRLWSPLPQARVSDGHRWRTVPLAGEAREMTLTRPVARYRNEYGDGADTAVYALVIETDDAVELPDTDRRSLGVVVQPIS